MNVQAPVWSPDGLTLAATRTGDDRVGVLLLVDAGSGAKVEVEPAVKSGILWPAAFVPDGKSLLVRALNADGFLQLAVLTLTPKEAGQPPKVGPMKFLGPADGDVTDVCWGKSGVFFVVNEGGPSRLFHLRDLAEKPRPVDLPEGVVSQPTLHERIAWMWAAGPDQAAEVLVTA